MIYNGMPLIESNILTKGISNVPKRRNKNKRIQKKLIKKYGYVPIPDPNVYILEGRVIGHPLTINKLKRKLKKA